MSGHYAAAMKLKQRWWNCNDAAAESMEEGKVVPESAYIPFYKQIWCLETAMSDRAFG